MMENGITVDFWRCRSVLYNGVDSMAEHLHQNLHSKCCFKYASGSSANPSFSTLSVNTPIFCLLTIFVYSPQVCVFTICSLHKNLPSTLTAGQKHLKKQPLSKNRRLNLHLSTHFYSYFPKQLPFFSTNSFSSKPTFPLSYPRLHI